MFFSDENINYLKKKSEMNSVVVVVAFRKFYFY